jgi:hypothetical protein
MSEKRPKAFISYSHEDRDLATRVAEGLAAGGIEAWIDKWEILAGDSIIQKIFNEGLSGADYFVIILSPNSIKSNWVMHELDVALIKRIEGVTRVIPLKVGEIEIPQALRPLRWIDMNGDFNEKIRELIMSIFQVREKPIIGQPPDFIRNRIASVGGLSRLATAMGLVLANTGIEETGMEENWNSSELSKKLGFTPQETDDAIDELKRLGLVKTIDYFGTFPFSHGEVEPTYTLFLQFKNNGLSYDPDIDIKTVASAIVAEQKIDGDKLQKLTGLSPLRINRAVAYIEDYGLANVTRSFGTGTYDFSLIATSGSTRSFVEKNSK